MAATQQQSGRKVIQFKQRTSSARDLPEIPDGGWEFQIPKGGCKALESSKGDPRILIPHKLIEAHEDDNKTFVNAVATQGLSFPDDADPTRVKGGNFTRRTLRNLCEAVGVSYADVYPTEIKDSTSFDELFNALEGKKGTCWTRTRTSTMASGEPITNTDILYKEPQKGLVDRDGGDEEDDDRPGRRGGAGKKNGRR
jgi:hypothetical protein